MSKRSGKRRGAPGTRRTAAAKPGREPQRSDTPGSAGRAARESGLGLGAEIGIAVGVFLVVTAIAELAGAANLGVAAAVGQIAFAIALVVLLLRGP